MFALSLKERIQPIKGKKALAVRRGWEVPNQGQLYYSLQVNKAVYDLTHVFSICTLMLLFRPWFSFLALFIRPMFFQTCPGMSLYCPCAESGRIEYDQMYGFFVW